MSHALQLDFFPHDRDLCGPIPSDPCLWHDGISAWLVKHGVELGSAKIKGTAIVSAFQVSEPDVKRSALQLFPGEGAKSIWTWEGLDVLAGRGQILDGRGGNVLH
jgi:hypothetical protein